MQLQLLRALHSSAIVSRLRHADQIFKIQKTDSLTTMSCEGDLFVCSAMTR